MQLHHCMDSFINTSQFIRFTCLTSCYVRFSCTTIFTFTENALEKT